MCKESVLFCRDVFGSKDEAGLPAIVKDSSMDVLFHTAVSVVCAGWFRDSIPPLGSFVSLVPKAAEGGCRPNKLWPCR